MLSQAGLPRATAGFAGDTAISVEVRDHIAASIVPVATAAAILDLARMLLLLRSPVTPLCLLVVSLLTVAAPLGLTVYVFRNLLGHGYIDFYVQLRGGSTPCLPGRGHSCGTVTRTVAWQLGNIRRPRAGRSEATMAEHPRETTRQVVGKGAVVRWRPRLSS